MESNLEQRITTCESFRRTVETLSLSLKYLQDDRNNAGIQKEIRDTIKLSNDKLKLKIAELN